MGKRRRHPVSHLRHQGAEAGNEGGKDHDATHYATLDPNTDITTLAAKSRLTAVRKAAILTKRMSEALTGSQRHMRA
jgi:hypothetical protein